MHCNPVKLELENGKRKIDDVGKSLTKCCVAIDIVFKQILFSIMYSFLYFE